MKKNNLLILLIFFGLISCQNSKEEQFAEVSMTKLNTPEKTEERLVVGENRKIIKNANVEFNISDIGETDGKIGSLVRKLNGYVSWEKEKKEVDRISKSLTIRVPSKNFDLFFSEFDKLDFDIIDKEIGLTDVTEEYVDVEARLKNRKQVELKYLNLLTKANSVEDILSIPHFTGQLYIKN